MKYNDFSLKDAFKSLEDVDEVVVTRGMILSEGIDKNKIRTSKTSKKLTESLTKEEKREVAEGIETIINMFTGGLDWSETEELYDKLDQQVSSEIYSKLTEKDIADIGRQMGYYVWEVDAHNDGRIWTVISKYDEEDLLNTDGEYRLFVEDEFEPDEDYEPKTPVIPDLDNVQFEDDEMDENLKESSSTVESLFDAEEQNKQVVRKMKKLIEGDTWSEINELAYYVTNHFKFDISEKTIRKIAKELGYEVFTVKASGDDTTIVSKYDAKTLFDKNDIFRDFVNDNLVIVPESEKKLSLGERTAQLVAEAFEGECGPAGGEDPYLEGNRVGLHSQNPVEWFRFNDDGSVDFENISRLVWDNPEDWGFEADDEEGINEFIKAYSHFDTVQDLLDSDLGWWYNAEIDLSSLKECKLEEKELTEVKTTELPIIKELKEEDDFKILSDEDIAKVLQIYIKDQKENFDNITYLDKLTADEIKEWLDDLGGWAGFVFEFMDLDKGAPTMQLLQKIIPSDERLMNAVKEYADENKLLEPAGESEGIEKTNTNYILYVFDKDENDGVMSDTIDAIQKIYLKEPVTESLTEAFSESIPEWVKGAIDVDRKNRKWNNERNNLGLKERGVDLANAEFVEVSPEDVKLADFRDTDTGKIFAFEFKIPWSTNPEYAHTVVSIPVIDKLDISQYNPITKTYTKMASWSKKQLMSYINKAGYFVAPLKSDIDKTEVQQKRTERTKVQNELRDLGLVRNAQKRSRLDKSGYVIPSQAELMAKLAPLTRENWRSQIERFEKFIAEAKTYLKGALELAKIEDVAWSNKFDLDRYIGNCRSVVTEIKRVEEAVKELKEWLTATEGNENFENTLERANSGYGWRGAEYIRDLMHQLRDDFRELDASVQEARSISNNTIEESLQEDSSMTVDISDEDEVDKGIEFLKKSDNEPIEKVVDVNAEIKDDLKPTYVGNVILQCPVCKTMIYKEPDELVKDKNPDAEGNAIYNVETECPHCGSKDGFELVGQVASLDVEEPKEDIEIEDEVIENSESQTESLKEEKSNKEFVNRKFELKISEDK